MFHYVVVSYEICTLNKIEIVVNGSFEAARDKAKERSKNPNFMEAVSVDMVWRSGLRYTVCSCRNGSVEWIKQ